MARNSFGRNSGKDKTIMFFFAFMFFIFMFIIIGFYLVNMNNGNSDGTEYGSGNDLSTAYNNEQVDVLVPIKEIPARTPLKSSMFEKVKRNPMEFDSRAITEYELITNMYAKSVLPAGVPFLKEQITNVRPTSPVSTSIPDGYRAVTIKVDAVSGVEGWAGPGSIVDVYWTSTSNGNNTINSIVQGAKVLSAAGAVNDNSDASANNSKVPPTTVTLLVTAEDAQRILLAQTSSGKLSLSLRGDNDTGTEGSAVKPISVNDIRGTSRNVVVSRNVQQRSVGTMKIDGQEYTINERGEIKPVIDEDF